MIANAEVAMRNDMEDRPGLVCRKCGCEHFRVYYTRPGPLGSIMRRRVCRNCGTQITTYEREAHSSR
jgi:transcriptional regulator NrdR family protein